MKVKQVEQLSQLYTLIWSDTKRPIPPYDSNPGSSDEGLLVYRSLKAAESAARHQQMLYSLRDSQKAVALSLVTFIANNTEN